jgi:chondroitin 4-sulfotransferase 11
MPVSHQLNCIFVHIPRTGGTSIESALGLRGDWRVENTDLMFGLVTAPDIQRKIGATPFLQHLSANELDKLLPCHARRYYRFAFVRNPWERMVSIHARLDPHMRVTAQGVGLQLEGSSFDEFLELTENFSHVHLQPQHSFVVDSSGASAVDFLGRFERLTTDFEAVCARLGINCALPHLNASNHCDYRACYDAGSRRTVERRYGEDIERFGYRF